MLLSHIPGSRLLSIDDAALVCGTSLVFSRSFSQAINPAPFDPDHEWLEEERGGVLTRSARDGRLHFDFVEPPTMVGHLAREAIPLNLLHAGNYFHFLIHWLPSLNAMLCEGDVGADAMIVTSLLHVNFSHLLRVLPGGEELPVLQLGRLQGVTCDRVLQPPPSYHCLERLAGGITEATFDAGKLTRLRRTLAAGWPPAKKGRKLFVRRQKHLRNMINGDEIQARAVAAGYTILDPGTYPLGDQVRMFREATHIVGPTGAWVANLIFAPDDTKVGIFYPETVKTESSPWGRMGAIFNQDVADLYCPVPQINEHYAIHSDFIVPLDQAEELLRR